nr:hypothetical protein [Tanacetum cinerariifolium]
VMAAPVISISSDVSVKSVGSSFLRVILIGSISVEVSVAPEVGAAVVASPAWVLELDTQSLSEADPSKSSPPPVSVAPMVLPFLCSDDSESDTEIPERHALTMRKSVRPLPSLHLALRYTSHHLDHFTSGSLSSHSSSDHSSSGHPSSGHSLSGHTPPNTTNADSSTPQGFVHPPLARSSAATVILSIHSTRVLVPSHADLLPPRKRFRNSISLEDSVEEDIDTNLLEDIEADATAVEVTTDRDVEAGIDAFIGMEVDVGIDVEDEDEFGDRGTIEVRVDMDAGIDIPDCMLMPDVVERLEQRQLEAGQLIACGKRAGFSDRTRSLEWENLKEEFRQVRKDRDDTRKRLKRLESFVERRLGFRP